MNLPLLPPLAMLGTAEVLVILAVILFTVGLFALWIGLAVWYILRSKPSTPPNPRPAQEPPPTLGTTVTDPGALRCPRCGTPSERRGPHGLCPKCALGAGFPTAASSSGDKNSQAAEPPPVTELSEQFPQLEILELIGRGGMGWVYLARQTKLDRRVALKILPPESARDPAFAERFQREARALARLNHPNIVSIYDFGQAGPYFYFLMEFVDGANLRQLERTRRLTPEEAFAIVPRICEALQYAHEEGIVHRDIKPENILVDRRHRVKIADFGLAKLLGRKPDITLTGSQNALGTPHYMAPEQLEAPATVDHRADIYALGVVFYEMLTGELPLGRFEPPSQKQSVDTRLDDVVMKSLERSPDRRYQSARAVQTDVESIASGPPGTIPSSTRDPKIPESTTVPTPPASGWFRLLEDAGRSWWNDRSRWLLVSVQAVLGLVHLVCLVAFFSTRVVNRPEGGHSAFSSNVGAMTPWFHFEAYPSPSTPFQTGLNPLASSMTFLLVGFAVYYALWRLEIVRNPKAGFWSTPVAMAGLWALFALAAVGTGTAMGHQAVRQILAEQGRIPVELRGALSIRGDTERDQALSRLALEAVSKGTFFTVQRAIQSLQDDSLHDRTARECALLLHQHHRKIEALTVAREIRTVSLLDATLAKLTRMDPTNPAPTTVSPEPPSDSR